MVYYEITYSYKGKEMTENGVAKVWLRDESTKDDGSIFLHDDQVTVIDLGCPLTEQHAAGGNTVLLITMSIGHNAKTLFGNQTRKSVDLDGAIAIAQNGVSGLSRFNCCVYSQYLLSDT